MKARLQTSGRRYDVKGRIVSITLPEHDPGPWQDTPWRVWIWWPTRSRAWRRYNWRWTGDHFGWRAVQYWEYRNLLYPALKLLQRRVL